MKKFFAVLGVFLSVGCGGVDGDPPCVEQGNCPPPPVASAAMPPQGAAGSALPVPLPEASVEAETPKPDSGASPSDDAQIATVDSAADQVSATSAAAGLVPDDAADSGSAPNDADPDAKATADSGKVEPTTCVPGESSQLEVRLAADTPQPRNIVSLYMTPMSIWEVVNKSACRYKTTRVHIRQGNPGGDAADFDSVEVAGDSGPVRFRSSGAYRVDTARGAEMQWVLESDVQPIISEPHTVMRFTVSGWMNQARAVASWTGYPRSGHTPSLDIVELNYQAGYGAGYSTRVDIHSPHAVLRRAEPVITTLPLATTTLLNGDIDLMKVNVAVNGTGGAGIAWKQFVFRVKKSAGVHLQNFRLRRGSSDIDPMTYAVSVNDGSERADGTVPSGSTWALVRISLGLGWEERIVGTWGQTYTLHAAVSGAKSGDWVSTTLAPTSGEAIGLSAVSLMGQLSMNAQYGFGIMDHQTFGFYSLEPIIWSDYSADEFHSPGSVMLGFLVGDSSPDWINGAYLRYAPVDSTLAL